MSSRLAFVSFDFLVIQWGAGGCVAGTGVWLLVWGVGSGCFFACRVGLDVWSTWIYYGFGVEFAAELNDTDYI